MRLDILVLALLSPAAAAQAGSIETIKTGRDAVPSVEMIHCNGCVPTRRQQDATAEITLAPGTQKIEIRDVDGVKKIYRTEAWLGGSPATYVSKALPDELPAVAEAQPEGTDTVAEAPVVSEQPPVAADADMIDEKSTTSAVTADVGAEAKVEPKKTAFDPSKLELRIN